MKILTYRYLFPSLLKMTSHVSRMMHPTVLSAIRNSKTSATLVEPGKLYNFITKYYETLIVHIPHLQYIVNIYLVQMLVEIALRASWTL